MRSSIDVRLLVLVGLVLLPACGDNVLRAGGTGGGTTIASTGGTLAVGSGGAAGATSKPETGGAGGVTSAGATGGTTSASGAGGTTSAGGAGGATSAPVAGAPCSVEGQQSDCATGLPPMSACGFCMGHWLLCQGGKWIEIHCDPPPPDPRPDAAVDARDAGDASDVPQVPDGNAIDIASIDTGDVDGSGGASGSGGAIGGGGSTGSGGSTSPVVGPCDIYAAAGTPCAAAYSMVRVLSSTYSGPLYQVRSGSSSKNTGTGGTTKDIGAVDGFADAASQDEFCGYSTCTVSILYDQSGNGNNLTVAKKGCSSLYSTGTSLEDDYESSAATRSLTVSGHKVYALYMNAHEGYRNNRTTGMPIAGFAQGIYELADGTHSGTGCCWEFGNASTDNCYLVSPNALFFGSDYGNTGAGNGPWFMGDTGGLWPTNSGDLPSMHFDFAFGTLSTEAKKVGTVFTAETMGSIKVGDLRGGRLSTIYDGQLLSRVEMMGGIILGIDEDNGNSSYGTFYEGAITSGRPSSPTDEAVFENVKAAGYGR